MYSLQHAIGTGYESETTARAAALETQVNAMCNDGGTP
jgi:hypothetical protein